jgi:hypothetical protein
VKQKPGGTGLTGYRCSKAAYWEVSNIICGLNLAEIVSEFLKSKLIIGKYYSISVDRVGSKGGRSRFRLKRPVFETLHVIIRKGNS